MATEAVLLWNWSFLQAPGRPGRLWPAGQCSPPARPCHSRRLLILHQQHHPGLGAPLHTCVHPVLAQMLLHSATWGPSVVPVLWDTHEEPDLSNVMCKSCSLNRPALDPPGKAFVSTRHGFMGGKGHNSAPSRRKLHATSLAQKCQNYNKVRTTQLRCSRPTQHTQREGNPLSNSSPGKAQEQPRSIHVSQPPSRRN